MKKRVIFLSLLFICYLVVFSQSMPEDGRFIPPSPTVAELGKYGKIPVSHYTGVPNISIPIYTLQSGQLTLPITLSYHAGGIRVDQIASWVGLGWSLNAGGIITTTVMGISDMEYHIDMTDFNSLGNLNFPSWHDAMDVVDRRKDSQPDIYSYNFLNFSGQFIRDKDGRIYDLRNNQQIEISFDGQYFTIIDSQGTIYRFTGIEETTREVYKGECYDWGVLSMFSDHYESYVYTAWFLTSITSADGIDRISFEYEQEIQEYNTPIHGKLTYNMYNKRWVGSLFPEFGIGFPFSYSRVTNQTYRLKRISTSNAIIDFNESEYDRLDLEGSKRLESISITTVGKTKQWDFNHDYFGSSPQLNGYSPDDNRLKLISIIEDGQKVYMFNYYGDLPDEPKMPYRTAFCGYDYWGYANDVVTEEDASRPKSMFTNNINHTFAAIESREEICSNAFLGYIRQTHSVTYTEGSKKEPDGNYMKAYTLKELHYPTGGYSKFDYEPHDYRKIGVSSIGQNQICGGLRIQSIENYDHNELKEKKTFSYRLRNYPNESSGAIINVFKPFIEKSVMFYDTERSIRITNVMEINSSSYTSMYSFGGDYIGYSEVLETDANGSKGYSFYSISDFPNRYETWHGYAWYNYRAEPDRRYCTVTYNGYAREPFYSGEWGKCYGRGVPKAIQIYDANGSLVSSETYEYTFEDTHRIYGLEVAKDPYDRNNECTKFFGWGNIGEGYYFNAYFHQIGHALLKKKIIYLSGVTTTEDYKYDKYHQISHIYSKKSTGEMHITTYTRPSDITDPSDRVIMNAMEQKHIIAPIIKTEKSVGGKIVYADYKKYTNIFRPEKIYQLETTSPIDVGQDCSSQMKEKVHFRYNDFGRVSWLTTNDQIPVVYFWNRAFQFPVVEIRNASYQDVQNVLGSQVLNDFNKNGVYTIPDFERVNGLRTSLPQALITIYTYDAISGAISSMTDPSGRVIYYEYDSLGRLKETYMIKNGGKEILEVHEYNYANQ